MIRIGTLGELMPQNSVDKLHRNCYSCVSRIEK